MRALGLALVLLFEAVAVADAADATVILAGADDLVLRTFKVTKAPGEVLAALRTIKTFDPGVKAFVFEDVAGRAMTVPVAEIKEMAFVRAPRGQNPAVQAPLREVKVISKAKTTVTVPARDLAIADNVLTLPRLEAAAPPERWEIRSMRYDPPTSAFAIEVERVEYNVTMIGGGGVPGLRKGMQ